ncbi:MarR family transcriptional regulator [Salinicola endophyticus]|uniref:MarR family transcriptional regulator n=1 Tax=Salinicola endophyticus TaxID=1949083 RepID=A0AB74U8N2_9GAMM
MPERGPSELDPAALARRFTALQAAHPELDPLAALLLAALHDVAEPSLSSARLSRHLGIEHALVRRAAAELEAAGWIATQARVGASPALGLRLLADVEA